MSDTLQMCCRLCLDVASEQVCVLDDLNLLQQLETCLSITVAENDDLPSTVCKTCVERVGEFNTFRINAHNSQEWLEATVRTSRRNKQTIQPLADSEYNSDSLLEFLNNTENIEEYLEGLGDTDNTLPSLVGLLDRQPDASLEFAGKIVGNGVKVTKITSSKTEEAQPGRDDTYEIHMEIDVLDLEGESAATNEAVNPVPQSDVNVYSCLACKSKFSDLVVLSAHMSVCDSATRTCFECGQRFDSRRKMIKHRASHAGAEGAQECSACGKKFANKARQLQHYEKCHNDFVAKMGCMYRCKECGDLFKDRLLLYRHAREHVVKSEAQKEVVKEEGPVLLYRCKVCRVVCSDRRQLYEHVKQHTTSLPQKHLCHACGKSYTSLVALGRHVATHGDTFPLPHYKCQRCDLQCLDDESLQKHLRLHERESVVCEFCGLTFQQIQFLQKHVREQHSMRE